MTSLLNCFHKDIFRAIALVAATLLVTSANAQLSKNKKFKKQEDKESVEYAYQTLSTTLPKKKKEGFAGNETRFQTEKPRNPMTYITIDRAVSFSHFGHKLKPSRRPPGRMKLCRVCGIRH